MIKMTTNEQDVISLLADESFQRWLNGTAPAAENLHWRAWLNAAPNHHALHAEARALWQAGQFRPADLPEAEAELQKLQQRLKLPSPKTAAIHSLKTREVFPAWLRYGALAAAAVLLLAWLGSHLLSPNQPALQVVTTVNGERQSLQLPDGTTIILNANSTLRYPADLANAATRRLELSGEAYFNVAAQVDRQRDFVVQTHDGTVQVAGTRFTVYERGAGTRVAVEAGKVAVANATGHAPVFLEPGQFIQFYKEDPELAPSRRSDIALGFYTTWWQDYFKLEDTPFDDIARRLEETYGVRVQVRDESLRQRKLSGAIENRDLDVVINALAKALGTTAHRDGEVVVFGSR